MFPRVRIVGRVLPGNLPMIHSQDLSSFLYAGKRCWSMASHGAFFLVLERFCSSALEQPSSSRKPLSSSLLAGPLPCCVTVLLSTALPCWSIVEGTSSRIGSASAAIDRIVPLDESRDEVCRSKPAKRNECCCNHLPWFVALKVPAKVINPLHWILRRLSTPDQGGSVTWESAHEAWNVLYRRVDLC